MIPRWTCKFPSCRVDAFIGWQDYRGDKCPACGHYGEAVTS